MGWAAENDITIDTRADVAIGVQLDWSIRAAISAGRLRPGDRLPALRDLAAELQVNHNTVRAAVAKLEGDGLLESRHGSGTFVSESAAEREGHGSLVDQVARWAVDAGVSPRELAAALYVTGSPATDRDTDTQRRRALRDEIAVLDRLISQLEAQLPAHLPPESAEDPHGGRILTTEALEAQRDALVRRLATAQRMLDGDEPDDEGGEPASAEAPASAAKPRRAPRPGVSPA